MCSRSDIAHYANLLGYFAPAYAATVSMLTLCRKRVGRVLALLLYLLIYVLGRENGSCAIAPRNQGFPYDFSLVFPNWPVPFCSERFRNNSRGSFNLGLHRVSKEVTAYSLPESAVVYRDTEERGGWGNLLLGLASAYVLSVALDRPFFIDSERFTRAFTPGPAAALWNKSFDNASLFPRAERSLLRVREHDSIWQRISSGYDQPYKMIAEENPTWWFRGRRGVRPPFLDVESNQWFVPALYLNRHIRPLLCEKLGAAAFRSVSNGVWMPNAFVQNILDHFCARTGMLCTSSPMPGAKIIGVHIRSEASAPRWRRYRLRGHRLYSMLRCISLVKSNLEDLLSPSSVYLFIASDSSPLLSELQKLEKAPHFHFLDPELDARDVPADIREHVIAAAELILLSRCHYRILSVGSTFGMCAHAMSTSVAWPFVLTERGDCVQVPRNEPCQHHLYRLRHINGIETIADLTNDMRFGCII